MRCGAKRAINEKTDILHLSRRKTGALLQKCGDCRKSKLGGGGHESVFLHANFEMPTGPNLEKASGQSRYTGGQNKDNGSSYVPG